MNRGHLSYNCFPSHDKAIKSRQGSDSESTLLASDARRKRRKWSHFTGVKRSAGTSDTTPYKTGNRKCPKHHFLTKIKL
ncbi:hypothetical protein EYF80_018382 [Liparis tanakae]|uniref:Uncharacterized protein n=1 Tax=Liparis tanakae TaxID=230148 RepID=A0A4Z2I2G5_9TELE|nr:hypothetical protein EYF80_018382 [Liparis tanakae]